MRHPFSYTITVLQLPYWGNEVEGYLDGNRKTVASRDLFHLGASQMNCLSSNAYGIFLSVCNGKASNEIFTIICRRTRRRNRKHLTGGVRGDWTVLRPMSPYWERPRRLSCSALALPLAAQYLKIHNIKSRRNELCCFEHRIAGRKREGAVMLWLEWDVL